MNYSCVLKEKHGAQHPCLLQRIPWIRSDEAVKAQNVTFVRFLTVLSFCLSSHFIQPSICTYNGKRLILTSKKIQGFPTHLETRESFNGAALLLL